MAQALARPWECGSDLSTQKVSAWPSTSQHRQSPPLLLAWLLLSPLQSAPASVRTRLLASALARKGLPDPPPPHEKLFF